MYIGDSPEEAAFRAEARAWLEAHAAPRPSGVGQVMPTTEEGWAEHTRRCRAWQRTLFEGGWAGITWPKVFGGRGGTPMQAAIFAEEQAAFDVSTGAFAVAIGMAGPTFMVHGTPEQQARFLPAMLRGDEVWCQLFSEPGSGSDLASLATRAVRDGDTWVVNGQKVWTSGAQHSEFGILLARTDPDAPKHAGITYFIVDMSTPGIEIRPLVQLTGVAHFNEVFLTDVRIPAENVVGPVHGGWRVAHTTLSNERAAIGGSSSWTVLDLCATAAARGLTDDPKVRQDLMVALCRERTLAYLGYRLRTAMSRGETPGPEASVMKLAISQHWARTADVAMRVLGADGTLLEGESTWQQRFLGQFAIRIGGGTEEIQRNVIGERALGLPREPQVDKDLPWKELVKA